MKNNNYDLSESERQYKAEFWAAHRKPFAVQKPNKEWRTIYRYSNDGLLRAHLEQQVAVGLTAAWYPAFCSLDIDSPTERTLERIDERLDALGIGKSQRLVMTTPSYDTSGNHRIYLRPEYKGKTPTHRLSNTVLKNSFGDLCEIYPQKRRKDRQPCGFGADVIVDGVRLPQLSWQDEMRLLLKVDPTPIESLPRQLPLIDQPPDERDRARWWTLRGTARELYEQGLQGAGTRHEAQMILLRDLWRQNCFQQDAARIVKQWIRLKHNGFSKTAKAGRWREVDAEIERQAAFIWATPQTLPDATHNLHGRSTKADLMLAAKLFPADAVRQKQFFNLASFCRARKQHEWIFISKQIWDEIASWRTYQKFQQELEERGVMRSISAYKAGAYSRRYQLDLPQTEDKPLRRDERNVDNYFEALKTAFNWQEIAELTRLPSKTMYRNIGTKIER